jgi:hypothetical protein
MSLMLDKAKAVGLELSKKGMPNPPILRVVEAIDVSQSMQDMFNYNSRNYDACAVQSACDQLQGVGLKLDDNGEIDVYAFDTSATKIGAATAKDFGIFVRQKMMPKQASFWKGTHYAGVIDMVEQDMFGAKPPQQQSDAGGFFRKIFGMQQTSAGTSGGTDTTPVLAFLMTDGDNQDKVQAEAALKRASNYPIYWNLVGIGKQTTFAWLQQMAATYANVGFISIPGLRLSDAQMYELLLTDKFVTWAKQFPPGNKSL